MPDYIYLLESRLSKDQQNALRQMREAAREAGTILFLTGDAVRDLTSGHAVRDLEVSVHGSALKLKTIVEKLGATVWGEDEASRSLYLCFPGTVRVDVISTHRTEYPKPGKGIFHPVSIQEDLRRRDFTVNAMAISLNEGSFGLLMDPLNGAADVEARTLRLVSNYGFLEEPSLLIRATRYMARLGWELDAKTRTRYENAKSEGVIEFLSAQARSQELEQIGHEAEALKVLRALEDEGWMKVLFPAWTAAKADEEKLKVLHDLAVELLLQGVHADMSAAQMQLLTAKLSAKELATLKKLMLRPGFVEEWNSLDALAAGFAKVLLAEENQTPSTSYKLFTSYDPEAILWLGFTSRDAAVQERFNLFLKVWPEARQRIPHAALQEMRITAELTAYREIVQAVFLELIDGRLTTPEEIRTYLDPHSPPAPPPQVTIKRPRAKRGAEAKLKEESFDEEEHEEVLDGDEDLDDLGGDEDEIDLVLSIPKADLEAEITEESESIEDEMEIEEPEPLPATVKPASKAEAQRKPAKEAPPLVTGPAPITAQKPAPGPPAPKPAAPERKEPEKVEPTAKAKPESKPGSERKPAPAPAARPAAVAAKPQGASAKAKPVPAPAKTAAPAVKKAAPAPAAVKASKQATSAPLAPAAAKAAAKPQAKSAGGSVKPPHGPAKPQAGPVKPPAGSAKPRAGSAKPPAKVAIKAAMKGKQTPAATSKAGKAAPPAKASKAVEKRPAPKPGKKR